MPYHKSLVVDWIEGLPLNVRLPLRVLALVWQEIGLHVRVREAIAVSSCQVPGPVNVHQQLPLSVPHTHQHLSSDLVVALPSSSCTVYAELAAEAVLAVSVGEAKETRLFGSCRWLWKDDGAEGGGEVR